jgi:uncharacterized protein YjiS (DUF1127 family)
MKASTHNLTSRGFVAPSSRPFSASRTLGRRALELLASTIAEWRRRARARRQFQSLCELDDRILQDIGLTRSQVNFEATRPVWWR